MGDYEVQRRSRRIAKVHTGLERYRGWKVRARIRSAHYALASQWSWLLPAFSACTCEVCVVRQGGGPIYKKWTRNRRDILRVGGGPLKGVKAVNYASYTVRLKVNVGFWRWWRLVGVKHIIR